MMINESRRSRAHLDLPLVLLVFGLAAFGVLAVSVATFSTSSAEEDTLLNYIVASYYGLRQSIFFLISPVIIGVITFSLSVLAVYIGKLIGDKLADKAELVGGIVLVGIGIKLLIEGLL